MSTEPRPPFRALSFSEGCCTGLAISTPTGDGKTMIRRYELHRLVALGLLSGFDRMILEKLAFRVEELAAKLEGVAP